MVEVRSQAIIREFRLKGVIKNSRESKAFPNLFRQNQLPARCTIRAILRRC